jgi:uncharacterized protein
MRLDLDRTPPGQSDLPVEGRFDLDLGPDGPDEVRIGGDLRVDNLEGRFVLRGELTGAVQVSCDRCLEPFTLTFPVAVELVVLRDAGHETGDSDTPVLHQRDGLVDLAETVREAAVLSLPQSRICREECRGICAQCGADLNAGPCDCADDEIDPRWEGLPD